MVRNFVAGFLFLGLLGLPCRGQSEWPAELSDVRSLVRAAFGDVRFDQAEVARHADFVEVSIEMTPELRTAFTTTLGAKRGRRAASALVIMTSLAEIDFFGPFFDVTDGLVCFDFVPLEFSEYWWGGIVGNFGDTEVKRKTQGQLFGPGRVFKKKRRVRYGPGTLKLVSWKHAPVDKIGLYEFVFSVKKVGEDVSYSCAGC